MAMALHLKWSTGTKMEELDKAIDDAFGKLSHSSVKQEQREAVRCVLLGRDCFVTVPTGFGKSAIFHALPLCASIILEQLSGASPTCLPCVIVISPLVSLMTDQVAKLRKVGITTVVQLSDEFVSRPETLSKITHMFTLIVGSRWRKLLLENDNFVNNILAIVVDEAHCIVKW
jgi:superfamily II DNA helicase RecQ